MENTAILIRANSSKVITLIGDMKTRSGNRYSDDLGMWQYLEEKLGVDIRYVYLSAEEYASGLAG